MDRSRSPAAAADRSRPRERRARGGDPYRPSQRKRERAGLQVEHLTRGSSPPPESKYYTRSRPVEPSGPPPDRRRPREPANPPSVESSSSPRRHPRVPHGPPPGVTETVSHRGLPRRVVVEEREEAEHEESEEFEEGAGSAPSSGPPVTDPPTRGGYWKKAWVWIPDPDPRDLAGPEHWRPVDSPPEVVSRVSPSVERVGCETEEREEALSATGRNEASELIEVKIEEEPDYEEQKEEEPAAEATEPADTPEAEATEIAEEESTPESRRKARRLLREGAKHLREQAKELRSTRSKPSSTTSPPETSLSPQTEARTLAVAKSKSRREAEEEAEAERRRQKLEALPRPPLPPVRPRPLPVDLRSASVPRPSTEQLAIADASESRPKLTQEVKPVRLQPRPKGSPGVRVPTPPRPPSPLPSSSASHREPHREVERSLASRGGELPPPLDPTYGTVPVIALDYHKTLRFPRQPLSAASIACLREARSLGFHLIVVSFASNIKTQRETLEDLTRIEEEAGIVFADKIITRQKLLADEFHGKSVTGHFHSKAKLIALSGAIIYIDDQPQILREVQQVQARRARAHRTKTIKAGTTPHDALSELHELIQELGKDMRSVPVAEDLKDL